MSKTTDNVPGPEETPEKKEIHRRVAEMKEHL